MSDQMQRARAPHTKPPFTINDIKKAIPSKCFQRSIFQSFYYVFLDLSLVFLLYSIATNYFFEIIPYPLRYLAWPIYWTFQGCVVEGLWIIAHDCGHNAFSNYRWLNHTVGLILHSLMLIPYFSWKISHRRHHSNTASLEREETHVPKLKSQRFTGFDFLVNRPPVGRALKIIFFATFGWPLYLCFNLSGREYKKLFASHFDPYSPIFSNGEQAQVIVSNVAVLSVAYGLYCLTLAKGLAWVFCMYGGPWLVLNVCIILVSYLNHIHPDLPYYSSTEWDWLRGSLVTVDRDYGLILNFIWNSAGNGHVVHHLFPSMPHYHTVEATEAMKPILGNYYRSDGTPFLKSIWREMTQCIYVESDPSDNNKGVFWFNNKI